MFISVKKNMVPTRRCIVVPDGKGVGSENTNSTAKLNHGVNSYNDMAVTYQSHDSISSWLKFFVDKKL